MKIVKRLATLISQVTAAGGFVAVVVLLALISVDIFCRYVLNSPLLFAEEISGYLVAIIGFLGAAETLRRKRHIRVEVFVNYLPDRTRWKFDLAAQMLGLIVLAVFTWHVLVFVDRSFTRGTVSPSILSVPLWIPQMAMVIGAIAFAIQLAFDTAQVLMQSSEEQESRSES